MNEQILWKYSVTILPGTGGESVTYSRTARIVFVPPSITKQTTGVLEWVTKKTIVIGKCFL